MEELIDVLDENGIKTGQTLSRSEIHKYGLCHRIIVVAIVNERNEILLQQRTADRIKNPNMWDISVTGHVSSGEDSITATIREISEEIGICIEENIKVKDFRYMFSYWHKECVNENHYNQHFYDFFIVRRNGLTKDDIQFQASEVQAIQFVTIDELNLMRKQNLLVKRDECYDALKNYLN